MGMLMSMSMVLYAPGLYSGSGGGIGRRVSILGGGEDGQMDVYVQAGWIGRP